MEFEKRHPIRYVAGRTGLSLHVIRAWERRYGAVTPIRTPTNRRLYSDEDIERLWLLRKAAAAGHTIRQLGTLSNEELRTLLGEKKGTSVAPESFESSRAGTSSAQEYYERCVSAALNLGVPALETALVQATVRLSRSILIEEVVIPFIQRIGDLWSEGSLKIVHEHAASSFLRTFLGDLLRSSSVPVAAPKIVVTTPTGQLHEFGALIVGVVAASDGWRVTYPGPNLPLEEIAAAVEITGAGILALSIVYPEEDARLVRDLRRFRRYLDDHVILMAGGRAARAYHEALRAAGAVCLDDIPGFRRELRSLGSHAEP